MMCIIGLGNPGSAYRGTRHNIGYEVVDRISRVFSASWEPGRGDYLTARCSFDDESVVLVKPTTFMNGSGVAVRGAMEQFGFSQEQLLVIADDFQLPLGRLRLRLSGSDGGHNGLGSIIFELRSEKFPRLRCGISSKVITTKTIDPADFVLSQFSIDELPEVHEMLEQAKEACLSVLRQGFSQAMNVVNKKPEEPDM